MRGDVRRNVWGQNCRANIWGQIVLGQNCPKEHPGVTGWGEYLVNCLGWNVWKGKYLWENIWGGARSPYRITSVYKEQLWSV